MFCCERLSALALTPKLDITHISSHLLFSNRPAFDDNSLNFCALTSSKVGTYGTNSSISKVSLIVHSCEPTPSSSALQVYGSQESPTFIVASKDVWSALFHLRSLYSKVSSTSSIDRKSTRLN